MDNDLKQTLEAMESRIMRRFEQVDERIHDVETKLLTALHGWARPVDIRLKQLPAIDERLGLMEERLSAMERKLIERGL